jgi:hypothetical protein
MKTYVNLNIYYFDDINLNNYLLINILQYKKLLKREISNKFKKIIESNLHVDSAVKGLVE